MNTHPKTLCILLLFAASALPAQVVPEYVNYQGLLKAADGSPLATGNYTIEFNIYDHPNAGNLVWGPFLFDGATDPGHGFEVPVVNGRFNVIIGPTDTDGDSITTAFAAKGRFIEIKVDGGNPILPRQQFLSTAYAMQSQTAAVAASLIEELAEALCPPGSIIAFGGTSVPAGWLPCDGSALKSTDYGRLSGAIGTAWGNGGNDGDPDTDFNLPDLRGVFLRGVNGARDDQYKAPSLVATHTIISATVTTDTAASITIDATDPFPDTLQLTIAGLSASPAGIPDGVYDATRLDSTTWEISGQSGFTIGDHTGLTGAATGTSRANGRFGSDGNPSGEVGSFQAGTGRLHRHSWGYHDSTDLWSWDIDGNSVLSLNSHYDYEIAAGIHHGYDNWMKTADVAGGFWTNPAPPLEPSGTETRPNNAAVHYIIKY